MYESMTIGSSQYEYEQAKAFVRLVITKTN